MNFVGEIAALSTALVWAFSSFLFTGASQKMSIAQLNTLRLFVASALLAITIPIIGLNFNITNIQLVHLVISGFIGLVIGDTLLFKAFKMIGPRVSMLVMAINPAIAAILAYLVLGETLRIISILGIAVTLSGIFIVVMESNNKENVQRFTFTRKGLLYSIGAAFGNAIGIIFAKLAYNSGVIHPISATFFRITAGWLFMLPLALLAGHFANPITLLTKEKKAMGMMFGASILGPYLGISLSLVAIYNTHVGVATTIMATIPIIMIPLTRIFYKEKHNWKVIAGTLVAVLGVAMLFMWN